MCSETTHLRLFHLGDEGEERDVSWVAMSSSTLSRRSGRTYPHRQKSARREVRLGNQPSTTDTHDVRDRKEAARECQVCCDGDAALVSDDTDANHRDQDSACRTSSYLRGRRDRKPALTEDGDERRDAQVRDAVQRAWDRKRQADDGRY